MKIFYTLLLIVILSFSGYSQTTVTSRITVLDANHNFIITNGLYDKTPPSLMTYVPANVSAKGAAFEVEYRNWDGDNGFDGYLNGAVGAYKKGGTYYPGIFAACGMPAQIQNIDNNFRIKWDPYQNIPNPNNAKWFASINVIFDIGAQNNEPLRADRDYDLVIEFERFEEYVFEDKPKETGAGQGGKYHYFCRDGFVDDGNGVNIAPIHPFEIVLEGITYQFGVRYKYYNYPAGSSQNNLNSNNKVHIKFIHLDNDNVMPFLDHPLKPFIDATKTYYSLYIDGLPAAEEVLSDQKVGLDALWVKSISAGYEVYRDAGDNNGGDPNNGIILGQHYLFTTTDNNAPTVVTNLSIIGGQTNPTLTWGVSTDAESVNATIAEYKLYRSENGGAYTLLSDKIYQESFTDNTAQSGSEYSYYVTAVDRSFNESNPSNAVASSTLSIESIGFDKTIRFYPNPVSDILHFNGDTSKIKTIEIFNALGVKQSISIRENEINLSLLKTGIYFLKINQKNIKIIKL